MTTEDIRVWLADNAAHDRKPASCNQLALLCGVGRSHMSLVLARKRTSQPLLTRIHEVFERQQARRARRRKPHSALDQSG